MLKTIDVNVLEWFDRVNGNSYFAGEVITNYGLKNEKRYILPFQYGYGDHYQDKAIDLLDKLGVIDNKSYNSLWRYCYYNDIILRTNKIPNCKKRELTNYN